MTSMEKLYENYKLCPDLLPSDVCLVVEQYIFRGPAAGEFERRHHRHVPKIRLSQERRAELLRALVARFDGESGMGFDTIVDCHLNTRGKNPRGGLQITISHPEPGVLRAYCGTNTCAWCDVVTSRSTFRPQAKE